MEAVVAEAARTDRQEAVADKQARENRRRWQNRPPRARQPQHWRAGASSWRPHESNFHPAPWRFKPLEVWLGNARRGLFQVFHSGVAFRLRQRFCPFCHNSQAAPLNPTERMKSPRESSRAQQRRSPQSDAQIFAEAALLHDRGRLQEAEQRYRIVLDADGRNFGALYRFGLLRLQQTRFADAEVLFRRAVKVA